MRKRRRDWPPFGDGSNYSNLETWEVDKLWDFYYTFGRYTPTALRILWPDGGIPHDARGQGGALSILSGMAMNLAIAKKARLEGNINAARTYEQHADMSFARLPEWARW